MKIVTASPIKSEKEFKKFEEWWTNYDKKVYTEYNYHIQNNRFNIFVICDIIIYYVFNYLFFMWTQ